MVKLSRTWIEGETNVNQAVNQIEATKTDFLAQIRTRRKEIAALRKDLNEEDAKLEGMEAALTGRAAIQPKKSIDSAILDALGKDKITFKELYKRVSEYSPNQIYGAIMARKDSLKKMGMVEFDRSVVPGLVFAKNPG